jgi:hypothetical protein
VVSCIGAECKLNGLARPVEGECAAVALNSIGGTAEHGTLQRHRKGPVTSPDLQWSRDPTIRFYIYSKVLEIKATQSSSWKKNPEQQSGEYASLLITSRPFGSANNREPDYPILRAAHLKVISCCARGHASKSEHCLDVVAQLLLACVH